MKLAIRMTLTILVLVSLSQLANAQWWMENLPVPDKVVPYKQAEDLDGEVQEVTLRIFYPENQKESNPAVLIFHGGNFNRAVSNYVHHLAVRWQQRGLIAIAVEFRTSDKFDIRPPEALGDTFDALEYVHENAKDLKVDPDRIVACGGSRGGFIAAALATLERKKPGLPAAAVVFNGAFSVVGTDSSRRRQTVAFANVSIEERRAMSPILHVDSLDAPVIQFHGTEDRATSWTRARDFNDELVKQGVHCELHIYGGKSHGFWNGSYIQNTDDVIFDEVMGMSMRFLRELEVVD